MGCGGDDAFEIEVVACNSPRDQPVAYAVFYSIDGEEQECYIEDCQEQSIGGCLIGAAAPQVPDGAELEMQVGLYEVGPTPAACSSVVTSTVGDDTRLTLALSCDLDTVSACPLPTACVRATAFD